MYADAQVAHAGLHLVGRNVKFALRNSNQATVFNSDRHDEILTGRVLHAYDDFVVVEVPGWLFGHRVRADKVTPVEGIQQCARCGEPLLDPSRATTAATLATDPDNLDRDSYAEMPCAAPVCKDIKVCGDRAAFAKYNALCEEVEAELRTGIAAAQDGISTAQKALNELTELFHVELEGQTGRDLKHHLDKAARAMRKAAELIPASD